jgi:hypothetical protein
MSTGSASRSTGCSRAKTITEVIVCQIIKINIMNNNIMQDQMDKISIWCFYCCKEGHARNDYHAWKKVREEEEKNSKPKVGLNVVMIEWD